MQSCIHVLPDLLPKSLGWETGYLNQNQYSSTVIITQHNEAPDLEVTQILRISYQKPKIRCNVKSRLQNKAIFNNLIIKELMDLPHQFSINSHLLRIYI